jgi:L-amino acid N-acyltransferase YncA
LNTELNITIRDVTPDDAAGIVAILNPIIEARRFTALDRTVTEEFERGFISRFPDRGVWKVAIDTGGGAVLGFQVLEPFATYTQAFDHVGTVGTYVDLALRRRGVARALFPATFAAAAQKGYEKIFTFVRADNAAALHTYRRHGFAVVGTATRQARIDGRDVDEIMIERFL